MGLLINVAIDINVTEESQKKSIEVSRESGRNRWKLVETGKQETDKKSIQVLQTKD